VLRCLACEGGVAHPTGTYSLAYKPESEENDDKTTLGFISLSFSMLFSTSYPLFLFLNTTFSVSLCVWTLLPKTKTTLPFP